MNVSESRTITEASATRKTLRKTDEKSTQLNSFSSAKLHNEAYNVYAKNIENTSLVFVPGLADYWMQDKATQLR